MEQLTGDLLCTLAKIILEGYSRFALFLQELSHFYQDAPEIFSLTFM